MEVSDNSVGAEAEVDEAAVDAVEPAVDAVESDKVTRKANGEPMDDNDDAHVPVDKKDAQVNVKKQPQQDEAGLFKRPRGRGRNGKAWNVFTGQWEDDDAAQSPDSKKKTSKQKMKCTDLAMPLKQLLDLCGKCPKDQDDPEFASNLHKFHCILNHHPQLVNAKDEETELTPLKAVLKAGVNGFTLYLNALLDRGATVEEDAVQYATTHADLFTKILGVDVVTWMKTKDISGSGLALASSSQVLAMP